MLPIDQNKLLQLACRITTVNYLTVQLCQDNYTTQNLLRITYFFLIVGGVMCIRNLLPILSFKQVTYMSYGLVLVWSTSLIMRGLRVWCDTHVRESRHWSNVVITFTTCTQSGFCWHLSLKLLLKMSQTRRLSVDNMNRAIGMLQACCD